MGTDVKVLHQSLHKAKSTKFEGYVCRRASVNFIRFQKSSADKRSCQDVYRAYPMTLSEQFTTAFGTN